MGQFFQDENSFVVAFVKTPGALDHADGGLDGGEGLEGMHGGDGTLTEIAGVFEYFAGKGAGKMGDDGARRKGALAGEVLSYQMDGVIGDTKED